MLRKIANGKSISPLLEFMPNEKFDNLEFGKKKKGSNLLYFNSRRL